MLPLIALGLPALAFAPSESVHIGMEPVRVYKVHDDQQLRLRHGDAWQAFTGGEGEGWMARFDERTGLPLRAWGAGIDLGPLDNSQQVDAALRGFLDRQAGLTGVKTSQLRLGRAQHDAETDSWIVRYDQVLDGPNQATGADLSRFEHFADHGQPVVWRGEIHARIRYGKLVMVGFNTYPEAAAAVDATPTLSAQAATAAAIDLGPHPGATHRVEGASLVVLPEDDGHTLSYRLTWMVRSQTGEDPTLGDPRGMWVSFVDAHSGELVNVHNQVRYAGQVLGTHDTRTVNGDFSTSPMVSLYVSAADGDATTDGDGNHDLEGELVADFDGPHFRVTNNSGADAGARWTGDYTFTDADGTLAEIDSWVFLHEIRQWSLDHAPDIELPGEKLTSTVNINESCNAYYDGNVNFYRSGGGCNNTGRIRDVNHHEWGHGFHYYAAYTYDVDGSVGEGTGDVLAFLLSDDPITAPYFTTDGSGIRNHENRNRYPDDYYDGNVHYNGQIFGGSWWDFWKIMEDEIGEEPAFALTSALFADAMQQNPRIWTAYDDAIVADDDNGDLSDGTPNQCELIEAFGNHGLGPIGEGGGGALTIQMETVDNQPSEADGYPVEADILALAEACLSADADAGTVHFKVEGGDWQQAPLTAEDDLLSGAIPALDTAELPAVVEYYVEMAYEAAGGEAVVSVPTHAAIAPFTFVVGELEQVYCEDFEDDDGGYTHELLAGEDQEGADDWMWDRPRGASSDPDFAWSGDRVWGNDLGGGNYNGDYQADKHNRLQSVAIDVSGLDTLVLQYRRWLNVEDSEYDQAMITANDQVVWTNHTEGARGDEHTQDEQWALHTVRIPADAIGEDGQLTLGWEIRSDGGLEMGGWNIDDVCVYGLASDANPLDDDSGDAGPGVTPETGPELTSCGCANSGPATGGGLAVLALAGLVVRRRREDPAEG